MNIFSAKYHINIRLKFYQPIPLLQGYYEIRGALPELPPRPGELSPNSNFHQGFLDKEDELVLSNDNMYECVPDPRNSDPVDDSGKFDCKGLEPTDSPAKESSETRNSGSYTCVPDPLTQTISEAPDAKDPQVAERNSSYDDASSSAVPKDSDTDRGKSSVRTAVTHEPLDQSSKDECPSLQSDTDEGGYLIPQTLLKDEDTEPAKDLHSTDKRPDFHGAESTETELDGDQNVNHALNTGETIYVHKARPHSSLTDSQSRSAREQIEHTYFGFDDDDENMSEPEREGDDKKHVDSASDSSEVSQSTDSDKGSSPTSLPSDDSPVCQHTYYDSKDLPHAQQRVKPRKEYDFIMDGESKSFEFKKDFASSPDQLKYVKVVTRNTDDSGYVVFDETNM